MKCALRMDRSQISLLFFLFRVTHNNKLPSAPGVLIGRCVLVTLLPFFFFFFLHTCRQILLSDQTNLLRREGSIVGEEG